MTTEKGTYGQWIVSDIIDGYLVSRQYYGYSETEAIEAFKEDTKGD